MASITEYKTPNGETRRRVKWRDPARRQRSKSFRRETDATKHAKGVAADLSPLDSPVPALSHSTAEPPTKEHQR